MTQTSAIMDSPMQYSEQLAERTGRARFRRHADPPRRTAGQAHHAARRRPGGCLCRAGVGSRPGAVLKFCAETGVKFFVLGRGSNLLVRDGGFRGVVICLAHPNFSRIEIDGERLHCGAGAKLKQVAVEAKRQGLAGVEFLEGIPGSVGGALRMNAGRDGRRDVRRGRVGALHGLRRADFGCTLATEVTTEYRRCPLLKNHIALGAVFKWPSCAARGNRAAHEGVQPKTLGFAARRAERRLHVQKPGDDSGGQVD